MNYDSVSCVVISQPGTTAVELSLCYQQRRDSRMKEKRNFSQSQGAVSSRRPHVFSQALKAATCVSSVPYLSTKHSPSFYIFNRSTGTNQNKTKKKTKQHSLRFPVLLVLGVQCCQRLSIVKPSSYEDISAAEAWRPVSK